MARWQGSEEVIANNETKTQRRICRHLFEEMSNNYLEQSLMGGQRGQRRFDSCLKERVIIHISSDRSSRNANVGLFLCLSVRPSGSSLGHTVFKASLSPEFN